MKQLVRMCFLAALAVLTTTGNAQPERYPERAWARFTKLQSQPAREAAAPGPALPSVPLSESVLPPQNAPDVRVRPTTNTTQSEMSIFVSPLNNNVVLASANASDFPVSVIYGTGVYWSTDAGLTWSGFDQPPAGNTNRGDPASVIDRNGYFYVGSIALNNGQGVMRSTNGGITWNYFQVSNPNGDLLDKNHLWVDNSTASTHQGNLYAAWTDFGQPDPNPIEYARSTDMGATWVNTQNISGTIMNSSEFGQGANLQTGPNGEVYVAWSINQGTSPFTERAIGFNKSTDGGVTWGPGSRAIPNILGIRTSSFSPYGIRSNSFPTMGVSMATGNVYIAWTNIGVPGVNTGDPDIYMIKSTNQGASWGTPVRVNSDPVGNGARQWFPWLTVDPETDQISIVFYDGRNYIGTNRADVVVAHSIDGGATFDNFVVNDSSFTVGPLPGFGGNYNGDYIGIASRGGKAYPIWSAQVPSTNSQGWVSPILYADPTDPNPPTNVTAYSDFTTPTSIQLSWTNPTTLVNGNPIGSFVMRIKRNGVQITEVTPPTATFNDGGRTTYTQYTYTLETRLTANDSLSFPVQASATAGGSPFPSPPTNVGFSATTTQATITWTNPTTQADGTPIHNFAGTRVWRNGVLIDSVGPAATLYVNTPPPGFTYTYYLEAFNNLVPRRYSARSASVGGYVGSLPSVLVWKPNAAATTSADSIAASLTRLGISNFKTDTLYQFGTNLSPFQAIFVAVGIYPNNFVIAASRSEGGALNSYVQTGGNLYLEGGDVFNYDPEAASGYQVRPIFGLNDGPDGGADISSVTGRTTFNGLTFSYTGGNNFMDELKPTDGGARILWIAPGSTPANDTMGVYNNYMNGRSVASVVEFGGLVDAGANKKDSVMARIMAFFTQTAAPPEILIAPASLADTLQAGVSNNKTLTISNTTTPPAQPLIVGLSEGVTWLSISPIADTIAGGANKNFTVTFNATGMTPGNYSTNIVVTSNDPDEPTTNVPVSLRVTGAPTLTTRPDSLVKVVAPGGTATDTLVIKNTGQGPLTWSITDIPGGANRLYTPQPQADDLYPSRVGRDGWPIPLGKNDADIHHGPPVTEGQGGPDSAGYRWIDSDEPGGPVFNWFDISGIGTPIATGEWLGSGGTPNADDGRVVKPLPFSFPFYGVSYNNIKIVTNGWMSFATSSTSTAFTNGAIPSTAEPNNALYPWWDDLDLRDQGSVHYYHDTPNNRFIIQFTNVPHYGTSQPGVYTYQVILYADGRILYQYLNMQQTLNSATIGIENPSGTVALQVVFNAAYMHNNLAILIAKDVFWLSENPTSGTINPGDSTKVVVTFDAAGLADVSYTANLEILSNDPGNSPKRIPVRMIVGSGQVGVPILEGWNIISNPVNTPDDSVRQLFPTANFAYAFAYAPGVGYSQQHKLAKGKGYWEKFPSATTQLISGSMRMADTVALVEGWNLVGSLSVPIDTAATIGVPANIKGSPFFSFVHGYVASGTIVPGKGYWLKANSNGSLIMTAPAPSIVASSQSQTVTVTDPLRGLGSITISDRGGRSQTLYFGSTLSTSASYFELPPPAPEGAFDVRFESGRMVERISSDVDGQTDRPITLRTGEGPIEVSWELPASADRMMLRDGSSQEHFAAKVLEGAGSMTISARRVTRLVLTVQSATVPPEFVLGRNYPNPFNPTTAIRFGLPEGSEVSLRVYDLLGREVALLAQGNYPAGFYTVEWNGKNNSGQTLSSGVYFYRLDAKGATGSMHTLQNRMILMK